MRPNNLFRKRSNNIFLDVRTSGNPGKFRRDKYQVYTRFILSWLIYQVYIPGIWQDIYLVPGIRQDSPNKVYVLSCWMDVCLLSVRLMHRMSLSMHGDFPPKSYTVLNIAVVYDNIYHDYTWGIPRLLRFSIHCVFTSNELPPKVRASMYRWILRRGACESFLSWSLKVHRFKAEACKSSISRCWSHKHGSPCVLPGQA